MPVKKKPSPAQLAARAKFVAMVRAKSKAKKSATKKSALKKKAAPKKVAKKKVATKKASTHKDTKSHNVRINVVSGVNPYAINEIQRLTKYNDELQRYIEGGKNKLKTDKSLSDFNKGVLKITIGRYKYLLSDNKKRITQLKKHIK
jgi:hypothetical protein